MNELTSLHNYGSADNNISLESVIAYTTLLLINLY